MHIESLKLRNFRSFASSNPDLEAFVGPQSIDVTLEPETSVFIGRNGAEKSALIQALLRLFGETRDERSVQPSDFFVSPNERLETQPLRRLFIEAVLHFPELAAEGGDADKTVPPAFRHMVVESEGSPPYVRMRLEATFDLLRRCLPRPRATHDDAVRL